MGANAVRTLADELVRECSVRLTQDAAARRYTTVSSGGSFSYLVEPESPEMLTSVISFLTSHGQEYRVLGAGSNLVVADTGVSAWVIKLGKGFRFFEELTPGCFKVGAAMSLMNLSRQLSEAGLSGLEFAGGIPATLGGATRMNAGAHGGQISDIVTRVNFVNGAGELCSVTANELVWEYRKTSLPHDAIVVDIELQLVSSDKEKTQEKRQRCLKERKERQPLHYPSFGSVFKNPNSQFAGALIEQAGLKGYCLGGAEVSDLHANWIVNPKRQATSAEIMSLIKQVQAEVQAQSGILLEPEVVYWD